VDEPPGRALRARAPGAPACLASTARLPSLGEWNGAANAVRREPPHRNDAELRRSDPGFHALRSVRLRLGQDAVGDPDAPSRQRVAPLIGAIPPPKTNSRSRRARERDVEEPHVLPPSWLSIVERCGDRGGVAELRARRVRRTRTRRKPRHARREATRHDTTVHGRVRQDDQSRFEPFAPWMDITRTASRSASASGESPFLVGLESSSRASKRLDQSSCRPSRASSLAAAVSFSRLATRLRGLEGRGRKSVTSPEAPGCAVWRHRPAAGGLRHEGALSRSSERRERRVLAPPRRAAASRCRERRPRVSDDSARSANLIVGVGDGAQDSPSPERSPSA
jgi:hypothetical protein